MFDADRPIQKSTQDRLNRTQFAKYLARCMLDQTDPDSLVVGLYGGWGVGKTSVINLILEELQFAASNMLDDEKPIILNFSPWSYSGQNELIYSFFRRLSSTLRSVPYLENADQIIYLLELYVSFFTHKPVPHALRRKHSVFNLLHKEQDIHGWESGRDLTLVKAELNQLLRQQKHKIIIIIDNISRLYDFEIKQIFQIVKSMGDYSNTAYLLAFDKEHVIQAIDKLDGDGGSDFVEKVIQLPFEIPPIMAQDIESILADRLNEIILMVPQDTWNREYWADVYYTSLKYFFENCRDITRFVNTLSFSYPRIRDLVNPVDFFTLTALEVFTPEVYVGIRDNKDLFTDLLDNVYALNKEQIEKDRIRCDEVLARNTKLPRVILLELLLRLFPRLHHVYQPEASLYHSDALARKSRRICSPDLFDVYFRLSMQTGYIQQSEFDTLLALAQDAKGFDQALTRLNQDDRITQFLNMLDGHVIAQIPKDNIAAIVASLLDNGDLFPRGIQGPLSLDTPMRIHRIIHACLRRMSKSEERFHIMQHAIQNASKSLFIIVHELKEQGHEHQESEDTFLPVAFRDVTPQQLDALHKQTITLIESWAKDGRLAEHPTLMPILYAWLDWGNDKACRQFVEQMTESDRGLVAFLSQALAEPVAEAITEYKMNPAWENYLEDINAFIPPRMLEQHAKTLFEDPYFEKLREKEQLALMIFLDLIKASTSKTIPSTSA